MLFMRGDKLYFHVFTFRESFLVNPTNVWSVKSSPLKCGAGDGGRLADLFQAKGREIARTGNPDAWGKGTEKRGSRAITYPLPIWWL